MKNIFHCGLMFDNLKNLFLQISDYICGSNDKEQLEIIQWKIQSRLTYLKENNLDAFNDAELLGYYETHRHIQNCIAQNPNETIFILGLGLVAIIGVVTITWIMVNRVNPKKF